MVVKHMDLIPAEQTSSRKRSHSSARDMSYLRDIHVRRWLAGRVRPGRTCLTCRPVRLVTRGSLNYANGCLCGNTLESVDVQGPLQNFVPNLSVLGRSESEQEWMEWISTMVSIKWWISMIILPRFARDRLSIEEELFAISSRPQSIHLFPMPPFVWTPPPEKPEPVNPLDEIEEIFSDDFVPRPPRPISRWSTTRISRNRRMHSTHGNGNNTWKKNQRQNEKRKTQGRHAAQNFKQYTNSAWLLTRDLNHEVHSENGNIIDYLKKGLLFTIAIIWGTICAVASYFAMMSLMSWILLLLPFVWVWVTLVSVRFLIQESLTYPIPHLILMMLRQCDKALTFIIRYYTALPRHLITWPYRWLRRRIEKIRLVWNQSTLSLLASIGSIRREATFAQMQQRTKIIIASDFLMVSELLGHPYVDFERLTFKSWVRLRRRLFKNILNRRNRNRVLQRRYMAAKREPYHILVGMLLSATQGVKKASITYDDIPDQMYYIVHDRRYIYFAQPSAISIGWTTAEHRTADGLVHYELRPTLPGGAKTTCPGCDKDFQTPAIFQLHQQKCKGKAKDKPELPLRPENWRPGPSKGRLCVYCHQNDAGDHRNCVNLPRQDNFEELAQIAEQHNELMDEKYKPIKEKRGFVQLFEKDPNNPELRVEPGRREADAEWRKIEREEKQKKPPRENTHFNGERMDLQAVFVFNRPANPTETEFYFQFLNLEMTVQQYIAALSTMLHWMGFRQQRADFIANPLLVRICLCIASFFVSGKFAGSSHLNIDDVVTDPTLEHLEVNDPEIDFRPKPHVTGSITSKSHVTQFMFHTVQHKPLWHLWNLDDDLVINYVSLTYRKDTQQHRPVETAALQAAMSAKVTPLQAMYQPQELSSRIQRYLSSISHVNTTNQDFALQNVEHVVMARAVHYVNSNRIPLGFQLGAPIADL